MAAQGAFGTDFYDRSILRPKHRAYYSSGRPVMKISPKGALGSHEIRPIHSAPSLGQSIEESIVSLWASDRRVEGCLVPGVIALQYELMNGRQRRQMLRRENLEITC